MPKSLEERLADYHTASVEPGSEQSHREIMRAMEVVDYPQYERFTRMQTAAPDFWSEELTRIEQRIHDINEARDGDEVRIPRRVTDESIAAVDNIGWWDIELSHEVYDAMGDSPIGLKAYLLNAIWTQTRRKKPFAMSIRRWAAVMGVDRSWTIKALKELVDDGIVMKVDRGRSHPAEYWVDPVKVNAIVEQWRRSKDA